MLAKPDKMDPAAIVAIAHTKEKHRSRERVYGLVREAVDLLGGMKRFVLPGQRVLIKPNQTVFYSAEEGCTTDPLVVSALVRMCFEAGADRVIVGESSGGFFSSLDCMKITGMKAEVENAGGEVIDLGADSTPNKDVDIPGGVIIKSCPLPEPVVVSDVIINVPKAKNHHIEPISGALKNWVGLVNQKWRLDNHGDVDMAGRFMDVMLAAKPTLNVVDALICGEGDGPIGNLPHWAGCILASTDPVATDVAICRLLDFDFQQLNFAREAEKRGLGIREPIEFVGTPLQEVLIHAWPGHTDFDYLPINFLVGTGVTLEGTIGHVKSVLDSMLRRGDLNKVLWMKGTPTIMIGEIEDPAFEEHLTEGPYIVFDDCALMKYRNDPRVHFVPGHPVLRTAMPELFKGLGVAQLGKGMMKWQQFEDWGMHNTEYGSPAHRAATVAKPLAAIGIGAAAFALTTGLVRRFTDHGHGRH